jgi:hypothetical protein
VGSFTGVALGVSFGSTGFSGGAIFGNRFLTVAFASLLAIGGAGRAFGVVSVAGGETFAGVYE